MTAHPERLTLAEAVREMKEPLSEGEHAAYRATFRELQHVSDPYALARTIEAALRDRSAKLAALLARVEAVSARQVNPNNVVDPCQCGHSAGSHDQTSGHCRAHPGDEQMSDRKWRAVVREARQISPSDAVVIPRIKDLRPETTIAEVAAWADAVGSHLTVYVEIVGEPS